MDNNYNNWNNNTQPPAERHGITIASLITGIASIPLAFCTGYFGIVAGLMGLLFGIFSKGLAPVRSNKAIIGMVCGIVGLVTGIGMVVFAFILLSTNPDFMNQYQDLMDYYNKVR